MPSPEDQLLLEVDAAKIQDNQEQQPGIGHTLYALKEEQKLPVRFHSTRLPLRCNKWSPCELEALAMAVAVDKEYDIL